MSINICILLICSLLQVLSKGQIVQASKRTGQITGLQPLRVQVAKEMIPSARLLVYMVAGSQVAADSVWIDIEDQCSSSVSFLYN